MLRAARRGRCRRGARGSRALCSVRLVRGDLRRGTARFFTPEGALLPAARELAQQVETAERRAAHLAEKLRELGIDPDSVK